LIPHLFNDFWLISLYFIQFDCFHSGWDGQISSQPAYMTTGVFSISDFVLSDNFFARVPRNHQVGAEGERQG